MGEIAGQWCSHAWTNIHLINYNVRVCACVYIYISEDTGNGVFLLMLEYIGCITFHNSKNKRIWVVDDKTPRVQKQGQCIARWTSKAKVLL